MLTCIDAAAARPARCQHCCRVTANRAESLTSGALVRQARGDIKAAEADLLLALQPNPAWVPGLVNLADLYRASNRDEMAGGLLQQALALSPQGS